jgi:hypothetical protein
MLAGDERHSEAGKSPDTQKPHNTLPNKPRVKEELSREIKILRTE